MYYQDSSGSVESLNFSLNEAVMQVEGAIFNAMHFNLSQYKDSHEDLHFLMYNSFNDLLIALRQSAKFFVREAISRTEQRSVLILVIYLCSIGTLILAIAIIMPVVNKVNVAREKVLALFLDIPTSSVQVLIIKCQKFLETFDGEDMVEEIDSDDDVPAKVDDTYNLINEKKSRGRHSMQQKRNGGFMQLFLKFGCAAMCA
eukprot:CAMPEP_0202964960 /NCGR_PEP_ID=MMETSP1396-20130829/9085_1 /ASSEMBLY_ACC=CAM_ASM_000872 /TAXON_ID= /ORGANISM="Pseudokeronopsis sp., Strain Brazil" /LENGTH=200 /DNA_ID=CAMNT_0049687509 /DNA_START=618 /DNA_END=1220 /DNA_ORIENTATION=-